MKIPPHIQKRNTRRNGPYWMVAFDYVDLINEVGIMESDLPAYIKAKKPMIYWKTWESYQATKVINVHQMYKD